MKYNPDAPHGVEVIFEGIEVETIREAFRESAERLRSLGNDSSVSEYQKWVAGWTGSRQMYKGPRSERLVEPLSYFVEATEDMVDVILDTCAQETRIVAAAKRYKLGYNANVILEEIEQRDSGKAVGSVD